MITRILRSGGFVVLICAASVPIVRADQLSERDQHAVTQHFKLGMQALLGEQYDTAEREFRAAVKIDPLYDAAFYGLGQVYMATRRFDSAVTAYIAARDAFRSATAAEALASVTSDRRLKDQIEALKPDRILIMTELPVKSATPDTKSCPAKVIRHSVSPPQSFEYARPSSATSDMYCLSLLY